MIRINKNSANEPQEWRRFRNTPGVSYASMPELRDALRDEQGHICAFCMRRIPVDFRDPIVRETSKIAHLLTRRNRPDLQLEYNNMVLSCPGNLNYERHCDYSQGSDDITLPLFNPNLQASISYSSYDGSIKSSNRDWDNEIQTLLCLNNTMLKANRKDILHRIQQGLNKKKWRRANLEEIFQQWENPDKDGKMKPYCGIIIWYLRRKLRHV